MAKTKLFETAHANGVAQFLVTGNDTISLGNDLTGAVDSDDVAEGVQGQTISITKLHWSGGATITETDGTENGVGVNFTLSGNGAWSQFNGWTPVVITKPSLIIESGTLFIEVKKGKGYN